MIDRYIAYENSYGDSDLMEYEEGDICFYSDHTKELEKYKCCGNCKYCYSNYVNTLCIVSPDGRKDVVKANGICNLWELKNE